MLTIFIHSIAVRSKLGGRDPCTSQHVLSRQDYRNRAVLASLQERGHTSPAEDQIQGSPFWEPAHALPAKFAITSFSSLAVKWYKGQKNVLKVVWKLARP